MSNRQGAYRKRNDVIFRCIKCDSLYDYWINYDGENYDLPKYGKKKQGLCHKCRKGNADYTPTPGSRLEQMLIWMAKNNGFVTPYDWERLDFKSIGTMRSSLSVLKSRNIVKTKKDKKTTQYHLLPEYKAKFEVM